MNHSLGEAFARLEERLDVIAERLDAIEDRLHEDGRVPAGGVDDDEDRGDSIYDTDDLYFGYTS